MTNPVDTTKARLRADLKAAMQAKRVAETQAIRGVLAAIDNAQAVPLADLPQPGAGQFREGPNEVPRLDLSADELQALLLNEAGRRREAAEEMVRLGRADRAAILHDEAEIVVRYTQG